MYQEHKEYRIVNLRPAKDTKTVFKDGIKTIISFDEDGAKVVEQKPTKPPRKKKEILPHHIRIAKTLALRGLTDYQICRSLKFDWNYFQEQMLLNEDLQDALEVGRIDGLSEVSKRLYDNAIKGNVTAQMFYLKKRDAQNWGDKQDKESESANSLSDSKEIKTQDDLQKKIKEYEERYIELDQSDYNVSETDN